MSSVQLDASRTGFGGIHGGHLAAVALGAMASLAGGDRPPRSLTLALLSSITGGELRVLPTIEHAGRTLTAATVRLRQNGTTAATGMAIFGAARPGPARLDRSMPNVPPPEECQPLAAKPVPGSDGLGIEHRPAAAPLPLSGSSEARIVVWMRLSEDRPIDAASALVLADGAVPALYGCLGAFVPIPTIELGVQFADIGAATSSPWVLGVFDHLRAADGYSVEDAELWTPDGRLVLSGRQLRRVLSPR
jgi:acyl-CoA thioesterase